MNKKAIIRSAEGLNDSLVAEVKRRLKVSEIEQKIDKTISGGFLVQMGDRIYDYTVKNILEGKKEGSSYSTGTVIQAGDGIVKADGLSGVMFGEILNFQSGVRGVAFNLEEKQVGVIVLGNDLAIRPGEKLTTTGYILSIPVGKELLGRVVDPLGNPLDGKGSYKIEQYNPLEKIAPGVMSRKSVSEPLQTGIKAIDGIIPIGRGQRELIIGDRQTGKTAIALTSIINQRDKDITCVYVCIGQKRSSLAQMMAVLNKFGAMSKTIIVAATSSDPAANQYYAPYAGTAIAEYFLSKGEDVLVVYDDLTKHAWAYRQISLLLRRPSGREAYPGDIFYAHSRLLERACKLNEEHGGGSITALPIIETQANDVSAYIPTNVISITDGQIYLESDLFNSGQRPAMNIGTSVSRVGGSAQIKAIKQVTGRLRLDLAQYRELAAFAQFASDLDERTQKQLTRGEKLTALLKQNWDEPMAVEEQVLVIFSGTRGYLDDIQTKLVPIYQKELIDYVKNVNPNLLPRIAKEEKLDEKMESELDNLTKDFTTQFKEAHGGE